MNSSSTELKKKDKVKSVERVEMCFAKVCIKFFLILFSIFFLPIATALRNVSFHTEIYHCLHAVWLTLYIGLNWMIIVRACVWIYREKEKPLYRLHVN